jgi:hypothetical protein
VRSRPPGFFPLRLPLSAAVHRQVIDWLPDEARPELEALSSIAQFRAMWS